MPARQPGRRRYKELMKITTMDEFLKYRVLPEHLPIVAMLRAIDERARAEGEGTNQLRHTDVETDARTRGCESPLKKTSLSHFHKAQNLKTNTNCCRAWAKYPSTSRSRT